MKTTARIIASFHRYSSRNFWENSNGYSIKNDGPPQSWKRCGDPSHRLDVVRLRDSELAATSTGEEFRAAVLLWCASWHQVPCGSKPTSEWLS